MSDGRIPLGGAWVLRLVQASPLVALALFAAVWFSVPTYLAVQLMSTALPQGDFVVTPEMRSSWVGAEAQARIGRDAGLTGTDGSFDAKVNATYRNLIDHQAKYVTTEAVTPLPFPADDPVFEPIAAWEAKTGARVWAWVLLPPEVPPSVVASAVGDQISFDAVEREVDSYPTELEGGMITPTTVLEYYTSNQMPLGGMDPVNPSVFVGAGGGSGSSNYMFGESSVFVGGDAWRVITLDVPLNAESGTPEMPKELKDADPRDKGYPALVKRVAARDGVNIWVIGPLTSEAVPLRTPGTESLADAETLGRLVWPSVYAGTGLGYTPALTNLSPDVQAIAKGNAGAVLPMSVWTSDFGGNMTYAPDEIAPQTIAFFAVFDDAPGGKTGLLDRAWLGWQRFVAGWFPWLVGASVGLMVIALIASPAAFVAERRRKARQRVREDMARMQRDAHDKVYNRLSALSKRVAEAGDAVQSDVSRSLGVIAEDIRGTVGELQEILGEEVRHASASLTTQPLKSQVDSVCTAQGARLGIELDCWLSDDLPAVSPGLGWDLQCIVEEAITNAVRHGSASKVQVTLAAASDGRLNLSVTDNGIGSAVRSPDDAHEDSTGLRGMRDRVAARGGTLAIEATSEGTSIIISVPLGEPGA